MLKDIAWLAGLLEGEGSFGHIGNCLTVQLTMTDRDIVERAGKLCGYTNITERKRREAHHKTQYGWQVSGAKAERVMRLILPFMGERRSQKIKELLPLFEQRQKMTPSTLVCPHVENYRQGRTVCQKCYSHDWYMKRKERISL